MPVTSLDDLAPQLANLRAHWLAWGDGSYPMDGDLALYRSGLPARLLNGVLTVRGRPLDEAVTEAEKVLAGLNWRWWVGPDSDPGTAEGLTERGYLPLGRMPIMSARLDRIPRPAVPAGLTIEQVTDGPSIEDYVNAYCAGFDFDDDMRAGLIAAESSLRTDLGTLIRLVGRVDGRPVSTSAVVLSDGLAGFYWICTVPEHRGQGIGAALTAAAMAVAGDHGAVVGTLQASSMGEPVYRRLGFTTVGEITGYRPN
jgi:ribosomal protein S18 acetylase RimI-like enzyme